PRAHPGRGRVVRAARVAPGADGRHEREGARALPRGGAPLLRGAGQVTRAASLTAAAAAVGLWASAAGVAGPAGGGRVASAPTAAEEEAATARQAEKLLDEWRFAEARGEIAGLVKMAPTAAPTLYVRGYQRFLEGDYDGAIKDLSGAVEAAPADPNARELRGLATEAAGAIKDHRDE